MLTAAMPSSPRLDAPASPRSPRAAAQLVLGGGGAISVALTPLRAGSSHASPPASPRRGVAASPQPRRASLLRLSQAESEQVMAQTLPAQTPSWAPASAAEEGAVECVVCFEPLLAPATPRLAAQEAALVLLLEQRSSDDDDADAPPAPPLRSAMRAPLPCGHACCAACLGAHLALAVPRAVRARPRTLPAALAPLLVRCPGLIPHTSGDGGYDLRCACALPAELLAPFLPAEATTVAMPDLDGADEDAAASRRSSAPGALLAAVASAAYLWARTRPCPHCACPAFAPLLLLHAVSPVY